MYTACFVAGRPALAAWVRDKIDVLAAIPAQRSWSKRFVEMRLPQIELNVRGRRDRHARRSR